MDLSVVFFHKVTAHSILLVLKNDTCSSLVSQYEYDQVARPAGYL